MDIYNFDFLSKTEYNKSISKFCDEIKVGRNRFYCKMRELGILDEYNSPVEKYAQYFEENHSWYTGQAGKPSYNITSEGETFVLSLLTEDDLLNMKKHKNAKVRSKTNYRYF